MLSYFLSLCGQLYCTLFSAKKYSETNSMSETKRYIMPCFISHNHGLTESAEGYIVNASDYDLLLEENKKLKSKAPAAPKEIENSGFADEIIKLKEEIASLKKQLASSKKSNNRKTVKYSLKVPMDEDEWIFVTDVSIEEVVRYDTLAEAEEAGKKWGQYKIEKVKA